MNKVLSLFIVGLVLLVSVGCPKQQSALEPSAKSDLPSSQPESSVAESSVAENVGTLSADQESFSIVAYNVENLFDIDGKALFGDYAAEKYGPQQFLVKLKNTAKVLATMHEGRGPEIILFQELEADQTPSAEPLDYQKVLDMYRDQSLESMLQEPISEEIKDLPAAAFLLKALADAGLESYFVSVAEYRPDPTGRTVAHVNATFSRFPVAEAITHQSNGARGTLEVVHQIGQHRLHTFNSHWKSGASNPAEEPIRIGNAKVVRERLDEILKADPAADVVLGGDFNSQYNQSQRFPNMRQTAINSILGSQGDELAIRSPGKVDLYNLWYELPPDQRRSDAYQGYWGTLMNMMITRGLYDLRGVQYVDNSFQVLAIENMNAQISSGLPLRWRSINGQGTGYSDHLPIAAWFRVVDDNDSGSFYSLSNPGIAGTSEFELKGIESNFKIDPATIPSTKHLGSDDAIQKLDMMGHLFLVEAEITGEKPLRIKLFEDEFKLWSFDEKIRLQIYDKFPLGSQVQFYGELDFHDGMWQFLVHDAAWLEL